MKINFLFLLGLIAFLLFSGSVISQIKFFDRVVSGQIDQHALFQVVSDNRGVLVAKVGLGGGSG